MSENATLIWIVALIIAGLLGFTALMAYSPDSCNDQLIPNTAFTRECDPGARMEIRDDRSVLCRCEVSK